MNNLTVMSKDFEFLYIARLHARETNTLSVQAPEK